MNLLEDPWIPVRTRNDQGRWIAPWQITEGLGDDPIVAIDAPRADFTGALMQFLIGLLQTAYAPEREKEWINAFRQPPDPKTLKAAFAEYREVFHFGADRPSFMEDFDLDEGADKPISGLFIEAPGQKTLNENADFFIKRRHVRRISPEVAAMALLTLQINGPEGGRGSMTSIRGGGPLTTLVFNTPKESRDTLWHNVWLNVLTNGDFERLSGNPSQETMTVCFPWTLRTRVGGKNGVQTTPLDVHALNLYWGMPKRIKLDWDSVEPGVCDLTGRRSSNLITRFRSKTPGIDYQGAWVHPLSPYREQSNGPPSAFHPRPGGIHYRHWLGFTVNREGISRAAAVVNAWHARRDEFDEWADQIPYIWAFGYDLKSAKVRCWYESLVPLYNVNRQLSRFSQHVEILIAAAELSGKYLHASLKQAWFKRPRDVGGDTSFITDSFWQATERPFYLHVQDVARAIDHPDINESGLDLRLQKIARSWLDVLQRECKLMFDQWAATGYFEAEDPRRISIAHNQLMQRLNGKKLRQQLGLPSERRVA